MWFKEWGVWLLWVLGWVVGMGKGKGVFSAQCSVAVDQSVFVDHSLSSAVQPHQLTPRIVFITYLHHPIPSGAHTGLFFAFEGPRVLRFEVCRFVCSIKEHAVPADRNR